MTARHCTQSGSGSSCGWRTGAVQGLVLWLSLRTKYMLKRARFYDSMVVAQSIVHAHCWHEAMDGHGVLRLQRCALWQVNDSSVILDRVLSDATKAQGLHTLHAWERRHRSVKRIPRPQTPSTRLLRCGSGATGAATHWCV